MGGQRLILVPIQWGKVSRVPVEWQVAGEPVPATEIGEPAKEFSDTTCSRPTLDRH